MSAAAASPTTVITSTDHGALITITAACGITFALLTVLIRIYARSAIHAPWKRDDTTLAVAAVSSKKTSSIMEDRSRADQRISAFWSGPVRGEDDGGKAWAGKND